jgi:hypothetical protein
MRVSLYPHELAIVERLTVELTRLRQNECSHLCIENVGPEIFAKLIDCLYARGNYKSRYDSQPPVGAFNQFRDPALFADLSDGTLDSAEAAREAKFANDQAMRQQENEAEFAAEVAAGGTVNIAMGRIAMGRL